jgi:hypothetical protein
MAHTLERKRTGRGTTFIEYAILAAISVVIGLVIVKILSGGITSGGKRHVATTTVVRAVKHTTHHAANAITPNLSMLDPIFKILTYAAIPVGGIFFMIIFIKLVRFVAMGGFTPPARTISARSVDSEDGERMGTSGANYAAASLGTSSGVASHTQLGAQLATVASGNKDTFQALNNLSTPVDDSRVSGGHQVHVGSVSGHKERWHRRASGQPKFR